jgi:hypothetical protein
VPPAWLTTLAWISLALAFATAGLVVFDILGRGHRQGMAVMDIVWPVTALYFGPLAWPAYRRWGRPNSPRFQDRTGVRPDYGKTVSVSIAVSHCGAGCTLGDIAGATAVFVVGWELLGLALVAEYVVDFALAFILGIAFQYFAIAPARGLGVAAGVREALKADTLSLAAFEVGLFGWMAIMQLVLFTEPHLTPDHAAYWLLMQVGMVLGFATAYPVNVWLISRGVKEAM